jgi:hypothetical protein
MQSSSTVHLHKASIDAQVLALDGAARAARLSPQTLAGWTSFMAGWRTFRDAPEGFWTAGWESDQLENYEKQLQNWQAVLSQQGATGIPDVVRSSSNPEWGDLFRSIKPWLLGAVAVYFAATLLPVVIPALGAAVTAAVKRRDADRKRAELESEVHHAELPPA